MLKPLSSRHWNYDTAAHLLNRAGFGGPPAEIAALAALTPEAAVAQLVDYEDIPDNTPPPGWAKPNAEEMRRYQQAYKAAAPEEQLRLRREMFRTQYQQIVELRGWWLNRMRHGPRPLQEKLVLFWHGHFATSFDKVRNPYFMWRQNEVFRRLATGNWLLLLTAVGKDPAMLLWLDQAKSVRQHPNENFAREVMELFALGEGQYTEHDITEAARALTGWSLDYQTQDFMFRPYVHDAGDKTIFGQTGNFNGDDFMELIIAHPQSARFITGKLWEFFAGDPPSSKLNDALADVFRGAGNNFKPLLHTLFRSEEFYDAAVVRNQVKSPVQWLVGTARLLECELPPPVVSASLTRSLGQDLFAPPNVKGWDGGMSWITTNTLLARYNDAATLLTGSIDSMSAQDFAVGNGGQGGEMVKHFAERATRFRVGGVNAAKIVPPADRTDKDKLVAALEHRLLQTRLKPDKEKALRDFLAPKQQLTDADIVTALRLIMSTPEYQTA
jgi:uncharacterized protein (DUF1800 family)